MIGSARLVAVLFALCSTGLAAQSKAAAGQEQEAAAVAQAAFAAAQKPDAAALRALIADSYVLRGPDGHVRNAAERLAEVAASPPSVNSRLVPEHVRVTGDVAVVLGRVDVWDAESGGGGAADRQYRTVHVLVRQDGAWKVAAVETVLAHPPAPR